MFVAFYTGECINYIKVFAHTSTTGGTGGGTNHIHKLTIYLDSDSTHTAELYDHPGTDQNTIGKGDLWKLSIHNTYHGFGIPTETCVTYPDIVWMRLDEDGNDGWLIDSVVTILEGENGGHKVNSIDMDVHRWIDGDASQAQTGGQYSATQWYLYLYNDC